MEIKNYEDLKTAYPDLVANAENKAIENAVNAERERMQALDNLSGKIADELINEAKYGEVKMTADEVIVKAFKEDKMLGNGSYMNAAKADAEETEKVDGEAEEEKTKAEKDEEEAQNLLMTAVQNRFGGNK